MLAGTLVYINAGTQLGQLQSAAGILSPGLIVSFVLLGLFPLLAKKIVDIVKARRVYAAPAVKCGSATSCCGSWLTPSFISPIACGPTSTKSRSTEP